VIRVEISPVSETLEVVLDGAVAPVVLNESLVAPMVLLLELRLGSLSVALGEVAAVEELGYELELLGVDGSVELLVEVSGAVGYVLLELGVVLP
jgi:hypothetical protein